MTSHRVSSGILIYCKTEGGIDVLLAHPGGPYFRKKDEGAWTIPKGEPEPEESLEDCARRELEEETGIVLKGVLLPLGSIRQAGGKIVHCFATEMERFEPRPGASEIEIEWPPRSGRMARFPEIDRLELIPLDEAMKKINKAQAELLERLRAHLGV